MQNMSEERVMMEKLKEKEWYKQKIAEIIKNINDEDVLEYLYFFIKEKLKAV